MYDAAMMRRCYRVEHRTVKPQPLLKVQFFPGLGQRPAIHPFHYDEPLASCFTDFINMGNIGVVELAHQLRFVPYFSASLAVGIVGLKKFDGHRSIKSRIDSLKNLAGGAFPDFLYYFVSIAEDFLCTGDGIYTVFDLLCRNQVITSKGAQFVKQ